MSEIVLAFKAETEAFEQNVNKVIKSLRDSQVASEAQAAAFQKGFKESSVEVEKLQTKLKELEKLLPKAVNEKSQKTLQQEIKKTKAELEKLTNPVQNFGNEIAGTTKKATTLTGQLRQMKEELAKLDEGSIEFQNLSIEAAKLEDKISDVRATTRTLASDTFVFDAAIQGAQALTSAYSIAQGATLLFGEENEEFEKSIKKVGAALLILQSLQQAQTLIQKQSALRIAIETKAHQLYAFAVGTSTGAMKLFRIALLGLGIPALIFGLIEAAKYFGILGDKTKEAAKESEEFAAQREKVNEQLEREIENLKILIGQVSRTPQGVEQILQKIQEGASLAGVRTSELASALSELEGRLENLTSDNFTLLATSIDEAGLSEAEFEKKRQESFNNEKARLAEQIKLIKQIIDARKQADEPLTPLELLNREIARLKKNLEEQALAGNISTETLAKYKAAVERLTVSQDKLNKLLEKEKDLLELANEGTDITQGENDQAEKAAKAEAERLAKQAAAQLGFENRKRDEIEGTYKLAEELGLNFSDLYQEFLLSDYETFAEFEKAKREEIDKSKKKRTEELLATKAALEDVASAYLNLFNTLQQAEIESLEYRKQLNQQYFDDHNSQIDQQLQKGMISETLARVQKEKNLEAQKQREIQINKQIAEEKKKQWIANKAASLSQAIINGFLAVSKTLGETGIFGIPLLPIVAAANALAVTGIIAQKPPKFHKGIGRVKRGMGETHSGQLKSYEVPSILKVNEAVINDKRNLEEPGLADAWNNGYLRQFLNDLYIAPALAEQKKKFDKKEKQSLGKSIAKNIILNKGIDEYGMKRVMQRGTIIRNIDELGKSVADHLPKPNPYRD